jgi:C-terminal processing protease CtpA/Prc
MTRRNFRILSAVLVLFVVSSACALFNQPPVATEEPATRTPAQSTQLPSPRATAEPGSEPVQITGSFTYSNDFVVENYFRDHMVALVDMHAFVVRDRDWLIPVESQTLGYIDLDEDNNRASYWQQLPQQPAGLYNDVDNNGQTDTGVQIFTVTYWPNLAGGPFSEGDDPSRGWPSYLASITTDSENQDEVTGGKLVVWSPDAAQAFPTAFGADGLLFTADDPTAALQAGYSIIDLDQEPFGVSREREPELTLYEPQDVGIKDYSDLSYTEAFDRMTEVLRKEYAFNDIPGKAPDWDTLIPRVRQQVQDAESARDPYLFYQAMMDFVSAFRDGHVGLSGGSYANQYIQERAGGGFGLALREVDDGSVIVVHVVSGSPAAGAGIQVGDRITAVDGTPVAEAISAVTPLFGPHSSDFALRYDQVRFLLRGPVGEEKSVTFVNAGGQSSTVSLRSVIEIESLLVTLPDGGDPYALPVEYSLLDSGFGYIQINSNSDDLALILTLFSRALEVFTENEVPGVIIDMRSNSGGAPLGLAGFLTDETIPMGQLEYYSEKTGGFEPEGSPDVFYPNKTQYRFSKLALLVDQTCYSACELEAYGFSQLDGIVVAGIYPSGGVEAEVARGQFTLPAGLSLQAPTGRFVLPDGSLFLEGQGVQPTLRVPITAESVLSDEDVVLRAAEEALR